MSLIPKLVYGLATAIRGEHRVFRYTRDMRRLEEKTPQEVLDRQTERLAMMLEHASQTVSHYRGLPTPARVDGAWECIQSWPLLEKSVLQRAGETLMSGLKGPLARKSTGGSTGAPVQVVKNADGMARERAATWMALGWAGIEVGDRVMRFWGTPLTRKRRRAYWFADMAMNRRRLSAFECTAEDFERHWRTMARFKPAWLYGYSTALHMFAEWAQASGKSAADMGIKAVVPTAEPVTTEIETDLGEVFGCRVQNEYGCGEVGAIAYACENGVLHVMSENVAVEILREDGTRAGLGESGEVVVTDLTNLAMPLVRYRLGDRADVVPPCTCGLPFPTIGRVQGRARDMIFTPAGRRVYGGKIHYHMTTIGQSEPGFHQYQFVQLSPQLVEVRIVSDSGVTPGLLNRLNTFARDELDGIEIRAVAVTGIAREQSGKLRLVKNEWMDDRVGRTSKRD